MKERPFSRIGQNGDSCILIYPNARVFGLEKRKAMIKPGDIVMIHSNMCRTYEIENDEDIKDIIYSNHTWDLFKEFTIY